MKPVAHPRGLIIETGEDFTTGNSATARSLALEVKPRDVDFRVLTELQAAGADGAFARVTSAFIQYVAGNWQEVADHYLAEVASVQETLRAQPVAHARNPETIATLLAAVETWLHVLRKLGALSDTAYSALLGRIEEGFDQANQEQAFAITDSDPVSHFLQLVGASLQSGDAHLASTEDNGEPRHSTSLGWRVNMIRTSEGVMPDNRPQGTRIGWIDQRGIFLIPEAALNVVQALGSRQGISIPWSAKTLGKRLMEAGKIRTHEPGRSLQKIRVGDIAQRALHIATQEIVMDLSESEHENVLCFETRGREAS